MIMYDYELIFDIHIENDAMKKEVSAAKKMLKYCKMYKTRWHNDDKMQLMLRQSTIIENISLSSLMCISKKPKAEEIKQKIIR